MVAFLYDKNAEVRNGEMADSCRIIYEGKQAEIVEKKSRFIASVRPVWSEEEAVAFIEETKKKYWDARHNCSAYVIGDRNECMRSSDDGEPQGTAGHPMLDVLTGEGIHNVAVVVTRYFGGTLLGTGGLVRAYSSAVQAGLAASTVVERHFGVRLSIRTDYNGIGKIQYLLGQRKLTILNSEYTDKVVLEVLVPEGDVQMLRAEVTEATNGQAVMEESEKLYYAVLDGEVLMGDNLRK